MIFTLTTEEWGKLFLNNERTKDVLFSQYALVSTKVKKGNSAKHEYPNVASFERSLYPTVELMELSDDQYEIHYKKYLLNPVQMSPLASIVKTSISGANVLIMTTKSENKSFKILDTISETIKTEFKYPVYRYSDFHDGKIKVVANDKDRDDKSLKKANKILNDLYINQYQELLDKPAEREMFLKKVRNGEISKDIMTVILKDQGLYKKGMSRREMKLTILDYC